MATTSAAVQEEPATRFAKDQLRSIIERIERLEEERKGLADNIKDVFAEAKSAGFDVKVIRQILSIRKKEPAEVEEQWAQIKAQERADRAARREA